jgi:hypothetical protein
MVPSTTVALSAEQEAAARLAGQPAATEALPGARLAHISTGNGGKRRLGAGIHKGLFCRQFLPYHAHCDPSVPVLDRLDKAEVIAAVPCFKLISALSVSSRASGILRPIRSLVSTTSQALTPPGEISGEIKTAPSTGPGTLTTAWLVALRQCRRRDSNPRHADYDWRL